MNLHTVNRTITDPADWDGSLFGTQMELVQLGGGEFKSCQTVTDLGEGVKLLRLTMNQSVKVRSRPLSLRYVATLFDRSHGGQYAGASIEDGKLLIFPSNFDFDASIKDGAFACSSVFMPPEQVNSYFQTLVGKPLESFDGVKVATPDPKSLQWLTSWTKLISPENLKTLSTQMRVSIQESLRDEALTMVTHAIQSSLATESTNFESSGCESKLAKARQLVRLAEDYSSSRPGINSRMVDLCLVTEVSERTLQYAFKTCLGISPMSYLKRHRLHQVRHELKTADPAKSTVSAIACQFGFFHFGEFSQAYKSHFDESPSQTLKRVSENSK